MTFGCLLTCGAASGDDGVPIGWFEAVLAALVDFLLVALVQLRDIRGLLHER